VVSTRNDKGVKESHGLSVLDIVKHASKTVIKSLGKNDRISIVKFSNSASTVYSFQFLSNDEKKQSAMLAIDNLTAGGGTNMWEGIKNALECLQDTGRKHALKKVFLLTDGLPTFEPPRGYVATINKYKEKNENMDFTLSTYGFGYSVKSQLLYEIAESCGGFYSFIPGAEMVGTNFVNSIATTRTVARQNCNFTIKALNGTEILTKYGYDESSKGHILLNDLYIGRSREAVFQVKVDPSCKKEGHIFQLNLGTVSKMFTLNDICESSDTNLSILDNQLCRTILSQSIQKFWLQNKNSHNVTEEGEALISALNANVDLYKSFTTGTSKYLEAITNEINGEIKLAVTNSQHWGTWGQHYIPSLSRAHMQQICSNFKDHALQFYTSDLFEKLRDQGDDIFLSLPPPKPSKRLYNTSPHSTLRMAHYYNQNNACFVGSARVKTPDGFTQCKNLKKGDEVIARNRDGSPCISKISVVVRNKMNTDKLIKVGTLISTPFHPIKIRGKWSFPIDVGTTVSMKVDYVYSFLLEEDDAVSMMIEGYEAITYAHGIENDKVATHSFFGTQKCVDSMMKLKGFKDGLVTITGVERDPSTGLVCSFVE